MYDVHSSTFIRVRSLNIRLKIKCQVFFLHSDFLFIFEVFTGVFRSFLLWSLRSLHVTDSF